MRVSRSIPNFLTILVICLGPFAWSASGSDPGSLLREALFRECGNYRVVGTINCADTTCKLILFPNARTPVVLDINTNQLALRQQQGKAVETVFSVTHVNPLRYYNNVDLVPGIMTRSASDVRLADKAPCI